ncbi:MAG: 3-oxoacyl-[acyl-carrier protein] reductase (EC [uncultured Thiotrichaceae bacterium]|uniref:3-oxoacyl-[acyl-carrier-protein] reductase n=1 Tax=uncultured Thiotrichaceae bacterium TaxID=298394 RepID=A0A6S6SRK4_9GAMM|nr:MAG: 3-oxoacyl-[acyl-carrier protein] reductase (EC [uncultured Thiotrichaceae bacterium]
MTELTTGLTNLQGELALVSGASRGIGRAIAEILGKQGATVIGTATSERGAEAITAYLQQAGISGQGMVLDVASSDSVTEVLKTVNKDFGAVSILVNNAGITRDNLLMRMKDDEWDSIINTNLSSAFRMSKACLRGMMKAKKGRIISIASVVGTTGNPGQANYAAAKAGLVGFSKSLAREIGSRGVTVNVVSPGFIDTDMTRELSEEQRAPMLNSIPLARLGQPEEIAGAVLFLASSMGAYVTGETIHVNGGMSMV